jgi:hypothetical protein
MKKNYNYSMMIAVAFLVTASGLSAQTSAEGKEFAKYWLSLNCLETANAQKEMDNLIKYKGDLRPYFYYVTQGGLEVEGMQEEEAALGRIYDQNIRMLNENKPAWITLEFELKIRSVSREAYIHDGKEALARNYKAQALKGLELIKSLSTK